MLERFCRAKQAEIQTLRAMNRAGTLPAPLRLTRPSLRQALLDRGPGAVIAEYKRASPSKGLINDRWSPEQAAWGYARAGAAALSVLTEETHFQGRLEYLAAMAGPGLPLLRKDFLLDPLQVRHSAATPASAVLLIARMLSLAELETMLAACDEHALEAVIEVFDPDDLDKARAAGAGLIQVNNRDLDTLGTDLGVSLKLIQRRSPGEVWISASGMDTAGHMRRMRDAGFDGLLIGTRLMREPDPAAALAVLLKEIGAQGGKSCRPGKRTGSC